MHTNFKKYATENKNRYKMAQRNQALNVVVISDYKETTKKNTSQIGHKNVQIYYKHPTNMGKKRCISKTNTVKERY